MTTTIPYTIRTILEQLGAGLRGARIYCGASRTTYTHPAVPPEELDFSHRPGKFSVIEPATGAIEAEVSVHFPVNGKQGEGWAFTVAYEPDDEYSVYFSRRATDADQTGAHFVVMEERRGVYGDDLRDLVCALYDEAIQSRNGGFINLS